MLVPPKDVNLGALARAIETQYEIQGTLEFVPLGEDSWCYRCGSLWVSVRRDLRGHTPAAYEVAVQLQQGGLAFVLAPLAGKDGRAVRQVDERPVVVFPYLLTTQLSPAEASPGELQAVVEMLSRLHSAALDVTLPIEDYTISFEADLDRAADAADRCPAIVGPYTAPLHHLLRHHRESIAAMRREIRQLKAICAADPAPMVVTHGEPIPSNILRHGDRLLLADWGDAMWGPPERDWAHVRRTLGVGPAGRPPFRRFYDLKWTLSEIAEYAMVFLQPHPGHADDSAMWQRLLRYLPALTPAATPPRATRPPARLVRWSAATASDSPLVCIPWAGAGASVFKDWPRWLPESTALWGARLPGRESRIAETAPGGVEQLAEELAEAIEAELDRDPIVLGYCSGAVVAYELAFALARRGRRGARALLVVGHHAPSFTPERTAIADLRAALRLFGYTDEKILENEEMMQLLLPAIRSDIDMVERFRPSHPRLAIPITAFVADRDAAVDREGVAAWGRETSGSFEIAELSGQHLFVGDDVRTLVVAVAARLQNAAKRAGP